MTAFEQALLTGDRPHGDVSPERLRLLGKQASSRYAQGDVALTDAVADVLRDQQGLGPEHVRRVTEFANTYAFDDAFKKEAGDHRVVNFTEGPADPSSVMKELKLDPTPISSGPSFAQPSGYTPGMDGLEAAFGHRKTAQKMIKNQDYPQANPHREIVELWEGLTAAKEKIASELASLENVYDADVERMYKEARQVLFDGYSPADVSSVVASAAPHPNFVKLALKLISERMERDGVPAARNNVKTASVRLVNSSHPLYKATHSFTKVAKARFRHVAALEQLTEQIDIVRKRMREVMA